MTIHELLRPEKRRWRRIRERQDFEAVRAGYNTLAHETEPSDEGSAYYAEVGERVERFGIPKDASILDAGCGAGGICKALSSRGYVDLSAFDISDAQVAAVSRFVPKTWRGLGESIDQPNHTYDLVISSMVIEHCMNPLLYLAEMNRVLKPDGVLFIVTDNAWWSNLMEIRNWFTRPSRRYRRYAQPIDGDFTLREFRSILTGCGFKVEETFFLGGFPYGERLFQKLLRRPTYELPGFRYFATRFGFFARRQALPTELR
jgi:2-polyprenyl-3-methyl-5-hydroxy-6-metoxy-1,4-benzoquinol methylase